ncbi:MAG: ATP-binding protein [Bdellovibrionota bacterium]
MARSDLLLNLIRSKTRGDERLFQQTVEAIIAEERSKQHHTLANQLIAEMKVPSAKPRETKDIGFITNSSRLQSLIFETIPQKSLDKMVLNQNIHSACVELIEEQIRSDLLKSYNIEPRNRILLSGPPGNGKTSLAEAVAEALSIPFITVRYDGLITSFLGETNQRLKQIFDYAKTQRCVLFFDEFDTVGKERGDEHETGEIKRVVSSLLMQIDSLPSHVIVMAASNHPELLDRAVWRRFQVKLELDLPTTTQIEKILTIFESRFQLKFGQSKKSLPKLMTGSSFSDVENFCLDVFRRFILEQPSSKMESIIKRQSESFLNTKKIKK